MTKFGPDSEVASNITVEAEPESICFANSSPPNDCFLVAWGSQEQFEAELRPSQESGKVSWPTRKAWPFAVTFEVANNATMAGLFFGEHTISLNLEGDRNPVAAADEPGPAPTPAPSADASPVTAGYFMGEKYGVAVTGVSRRSSGLLPNWVTIKVDLTVLSLHEYDAFASAVQVATNPVSTCFLSDSGDECVRILWGSQGQFDAVLSLGRESGKVPGPRGKGWPTKVSFDVPEDVGQVTLLFGDHRLPLDLRGMTGDVPPYVYRVHYSEIEVGAVLYDFNAKTITLSGIEQDRESGAVLLKFSAANNSEAADFVPSVVASASRVSTEGTVFDGSDDAGQGWAPASARVRGGTLAPGKSGEFAMRLTRVVGNGFGHLQLSPERPDAVLLELTATDAETEAGTQKAEPAYVAFERSPNEQRFWLPDLVVTSIQWEPMVPTIGRDVEVRVTVANDGAFPPDNSVLTLRAGGEAVGEVVLGPLDPGTTVIKEFTWRGEDGIDTFTAVVDAQNQVLEGNEANNQTTVTFGGAFLADLVIESITWEPANPSISDTVTFTVTIKNQGRGSAFGSELLYYKDGNNRFPNGNGPWFYRGGIVGGLPAGGTTVTTFSWPAGAGSHTFRVVADADSDITASDETNNELTITYGADATLLADLVIQSITWEPANPSISDTVTFTVTIKNQGWGSAFGSELLYYKDGNNRFPNGNGSWFYRGGIVGGLPAGGTTVTPFSWPAGAGSHTFRVVADADSDVTESDETNNELTVTYP